MQGDERRRMIGRENAYTLKQQPTSLFCYRKQPSKLNPVTVEAMNILFDLLSLVAPDTLFTMVLLSIHVSVTLYNFLAAIRLKIYVHKIITCNMGYAKLFPFNTSYQLFLNFIYYRQSLC